MAGVRKNPLKSGKYRGFYTDYRGRKADFTGTTSPNETKAMAKDFENKHRKIKLGYAPVPKASDEARDFSATVGEYFVAGMANGGRNGFGWSEGHIEAKKARLEHWRTKLSLKTLHDLDGLLPRVEKELRRLQTSGLCGKTLTGYADALKSFCHWCKQRGYIEARPLDGLCGFVSTPTVNRRALSLDEIHKLLNVKLDEKCDAKYRLLYLTALCTGLRRGELFALRVKHLTPSGLTLDAAWTKGRRGGFQHMPKWLVAMLIESAKGKKPTDPLLFVPAHSERELRKHCQKAGVAKHTDEGVLVFHGLRHTFITLVERTGAREVYRKAMARHAFNGLTDGVYTHLDKAELSRIVEQLGEWIHAALTTPAAAVSVLCRHKVAAGNEGEIVTLDVENDCALEMVGASTSSIPGASTKLKSRTLCGSLFLRPRLRYHF